MFQTNVIEKIKIQTLYSVTFFSQNCAVYEITWKMMAADDNILQCMLDNEGCRHTLRICNTSFFSMAVVVTQTCLNVTFICILSCSLCGL